MLGGREVRAREAREALVRWEEAWERRTSDIVLVVIGGVVGGRGEGDGEPPGKGLGGGEESCGGVAVVDRVRWVGGRVGWGEECGEDG